MNPRSSGLRPRRLFHGAGVARGRRARSAGTWTERNANMLIHRGTLMPQRGETVADAVQRVRLELHQHGITDDLLMQVVQTFRAHPGAVAVRVEGRVVTPVTLAESLAAQGRA